MRRPRPDPGFRRREAERAAAVWTFVAAALCLAAAVGAYAVATRWLP